MKNITDLPIEAQDKLRESYRDYYVKVDPRTGQQYVRFMGENVALESITRQTFLAG